jgi:hypothetical protein
MKKISYALVAGAILVSCTKNETITFDNEKIPITFGKLNVEDGVTRMFSLTELNGRAASYLQNDQNGTWVVASLNLNKVPSDLNAVYINSGTVSDELLSKFKQSTLYTKFTKGGFDIIIDTDNTKDAEKYKKTCNALGAGYDLNSSTSVVRYDAGDTSSSIGLIDHKAVDFPATGMPVTNALPFVKFHIYESSCDDKVGFTADDHRNMMADIGFDINTVADGSTGITRTVNKGNVTNAEFFRQLNAEWSPSQIDQYAKPKYDPSEQIPNCKRITTGNPTKVVDIAAFGNVVFGGASGGSISKTYTESKSFSWGLSAGNGVKMEPKVGRTLFGMKIKEYTPGISSSFSISWTHGEGINYTGNVAANKYGQIYLSKNVFNPTLDVTLRQLTDGRSFSNLNANDSWETWAYTIINQNIEVGGTTYELKDKNASVYSGNLYVHVPYFRVKQW